MPEPKPILLAGPTASGKSALALALARRLGGAVINADSQQVYREWRILTARPPPGEEAAVPHFLYGHVALEADYSAGAWLADAARALATCRARSLRPVIAGGTGLYFRALTGGLAPIPPVPRAIRARAEAELARIGADAMLRRLAARDPDTAASIDRANPARILRAWEVLEASGTGLAAWHRRTARPLLPPGAAVALALTPPRDLLYARCDARLEAMLEAGVLDEVARVMALGLAPALPGLKAVGAAELMAHLRGEITRDEALARARTATRHYARRQLTWIRNQMPGWARLESADAAQNLARALALIEKAG
ncbi:MAG TPA: tRNA (adenosine(37)-N6)-dimethylallyltransferase MiaA [Thermohalobaculum sp.]|nr:tRNA (adenosine(37)-N6)-dimethylallyltransferase MiaA [Thermohalobaculum sp.]